MRGFATEIRNGESSLQHEKADDNARLNEKRERQKREWVKRDGRGLN